VLDIGRVGVLLVALVLALRHRFFVGAIVGTLLLGAFVEMGVLGAVGLARGAIGSSRWARCPTRPDAGAAWAAGFSFSSPRARALP
jgi:hypothetical protein